MKKDISKLKQMMSRSFLLILVFFTLNLSAQIITDEQKNELLPKVKSLLKDYERYSQFSSDGINLNSDYLIQFSGLFEPKMRDGIFNDIIPTQKGTFPTADQYINFVKTNYQQGLDVVIDFDNIRIVDVKQVKGSYEVSVLVHKKVTGIFNNQGIHRFNDNLYFLFISGIDDQGKPTNLRINGILTKEKYAQSIAKGHGKAVLIGITGLFAQTKIASSSASSSDFMKIKAGGSIYPGIDLAAMITNGFGIGVGVRFSKYSSTFDISNYNKTSELLITDTDGDKYNPVLQISKLNQVSTIKSLDIPILLKFRGGKGKTKFYFDLGVIYSKISSSTFTLNGSAVRGGYYQSLNVILTDIPEYGFGTYTYKTDNEFKLKLQSTNFSAYTSLGFLFQLSSRLSLKAGASLMYGITELKPDLSNADNYSNLISVESIKNLRANNVEIGLFYRIPFKR